MYKSLGEYIKALEKAGELRRITAPVDPDLEIAEITDRISKSPGGGSALLFENTGTTLPVLTNMTGSARRISMALGVERPEEIAERIEALLEQLTRPADGLGDKLRMLPLLGEMSRWLPVTSSRAGECRQVAALGRDVRLSDLPILKCWPHDGGRFVTLPIVCTVDPDTGVRNAGMYRMQVLSENTTGMHWHMHKTGERHYRAYKARGERMPVSVCLGGDPVYTYAATAPMPDNMDEWLLAGFLRRRPVRLSKCLTNDLYVPSDCDIVLEGWVDPAEAKVSEGPFGDHTGFYSLEDLYPVFHVEAVTRRRDAVYPATIVGIPPQEDAWMALATEKIFLAPIRLALQPEIRDLYMPVSGVAHNIAVASVETSYPGQAFKVAGALWGAGQMMFNKMMMLAPAGADIRCPATLARLLKGVVPERDIFFSKGILDVLDHATATPGTGGKAAVDATGKPEPRKAVVPDAFTPCHGVESADASLAGEWGVLVMRSKPGVAADAAAFMDSNGVRGVNFALLADSATAALTHAELLWTVAGNCDPGRDMAVKAGVLIADGRTKLPGTAPGLPARWPNPVTASPETTGLVDARWDEYGLGEFIPSPSLRYSPLAAPGGASIDPERREP